ncbi:MAG: DNA alkylation repair protein [Rhodobacteraceae bacterium]|nr:MAG: DNA alkylation repair protein [Paracoccaceae bacterium]
MTPLEELEALSNPQKAAEMAKYHKVERPYLGIANPDIYELCKKWRADTDLERRLQIASTLWDSNVHEARIAATKLLTQARIRPDDAVWAEITRWVEGLDAWAIADHACSAGSRRLITNPARLDEVEQWTTNENMWVRRAAMVMTLPWTKQNHLDEGDRAIRERILGWAAIYTEDHDWFIQTSVAWWLRSLSGHDPDRVRTFIAEHGEKMKPFALRDAARKLG